MSSMKDQRIDGYKLVRQIGAGGFGEVWLCELMVMPGMWKAFKWIPASHSDRLERELEALVQFQRALQKRSSANLMRIEHVNRTADGLFYVMPLADGLADVPPDDPSWQPASLSNLIQRKKDAGQWFSSQEIVAIMVGVLSGLQDLSDLGLVHRDLKPENILFLDETPVIADISLVGQDREQQTHRGTPGFIAPTWYLDGGGHPDQYAAGVTLFVLMTGNSPDKMGRSSFRWPPGGEASLTREERAEWLKLHQIVYRATHETPSERFRDFAAMRSLLTGPELKPRKRHSHALLAFTLAALASVGIVVFKNRHRANGEARDILFPVENSPVEECFQKGMSACADNGEPVDLGLAARLFAAGAKQGHAKSQNMVGFLHIARNDAFNPESAFPWFQRAADQGDAVGQFNLGCCYYWGVGVTRDDTTAVQWFRHSAQQGFPAAQAALGFALYTALPPTPDLSEAIKLLKQAADAGRVEAMQVLAIAFATGDGVSQDETEAGKWREKMKISKYYTKSSHMAVWTDQEGTTSWRGANYVMIGRLNGNTQSQQLYEFDGVEVNRTETNSGPSFRIISQNPELTEQRIIDAIEANKEGARARNSEAELWIGKAYFEGRFLPESKKEALPWLRRAAEQGSQEALKLIMAAVKRP